MNMRMDSSVVAGLIIAELERLAVSAGGGTVGTVGEIEVHPGAINVIPGRTRISLDVRGSQDSKIQAVLKRITEFATNCSARRGMRAAYSERQSVNAVSMDAPVVEALRTAAKAAHEPIITMTSGAAHDTMCVATRVPSAMVFVPCKDGLSHTPLESANPEDAAVAAEIMLNAIASLSRA
jgi:acetylornithine deacetylase/succinyl-diaminopimelate desuccinylase-like protein